MGGWFLGNTNVLRTENNTLYLRTAPKDTALIPFFYGKSRQNFPHYENLSQLPHWQGAKRRHFDLYFRQL